MDTLAPYKLIDIGANLTSKSFNNRELDDVIDRSKAAGKSEICFLLMSQSVYTYIILQYDSFRCKQNYCNWYVYIEQ